MRRGARVCVEIRAEVRGSAISLAAVTANGLKPGGLSGDFKRPEAAVLVSFFFWYSSLSLLLVLAQAPVPSA